MSRILNAASLAAVGMTVVPMLLLAEPGFATGLGADANTPTLILPGTEMPRTAESADPSTSEALADIDAKSIEQPKSESDVADKPVTAATLAALVDATPPPATIDRELRCLAGAVYFESRGESLAGQLAVAHVIINRAESGRFPASYCGVVHQRSQFSFVRHGKMPNIRESSLQWRNALAIAQIARDDRWKTKAPGALFFHARYVSPGWRKTRVAQIDNHIFYR